MEAYIFHEGSLPAGIEMGYEPCVFNLPPYLSLHDSDRAISFYALDSKRKIAVAGIHFHIIGFLARSPFKAPFGSVECADRLNPKVLYGFLEFVELRLKNHGVRDVYIRNPPRAYSPDLLALLETFFLNQKYTAVDAEVGAVMHIGDSGFAQVIRQTESLKLRQAEKAGLAFRELPTEKLTDVFDFIAAMHSEKGYKLSVTGPDLVRTASIFPDRYHPFTVMQKEKIVAAAIGVRVRTGILYNFLTNHDREFSRISPSLLLMKGIYEYCRNHRIGLFDLGTSALGGVPNFSLLDFKMHIGGIPTSRLSFHKKIG